MPAPNNNKTITRKIVLVARVSSQGFGTGIGRFTIQSAKMRKVKDKGRAVSVSMPNAGINSTGDDDDDAIADAGSSSQSNDNLKDCSTFPVARLPSRNTSSKYDFVKVNLFPFNSMILLLRIDRGRECRN